MFCCYISFTILSRLMAKLCNIRWRYDDSKFFGLDCVLIILSFLIIFDDLIIDVWNRLSNSNCDTSYWFYGVRRTLPFAQRFFTHCRLSLIGRGIWPWHRFAIFKINAFSCAYRKDIIKSTVDSGLLFEKECLRDGNTNIIINFIVGPLDHPNIRLQFG